MQYAYATRPATGNKLYRGVAGKAPVQARARAYNFFSTKLHKMIEKKEQFFKEKVESQTGRQVDLVNLFQYSLAFWQPKFLLQAQPFPVWVMEVWLSWHSWICACVTRTSAASHSPGPGFVHTAIRDPSSRIETRNSAKEKKNFGDDLPCARAMSCRKGK